MFNLSLRPNVYRNQRSRPWVSPPGQTRKNRSRTHSAILHTAWPGSRLLPGSRVPMQRNRKPTRRRLRVHKQRQSRSRYFKRHCSARTRRHRIARRQTGYGGQSPAVQNFCRIRLLWHRGQWERPRKIHLHCKGYSPHLRRHQPWGHKGSRVLWNRNTAQSRVRHTRDARRPARHRNNLGGRAA